MRTNQPIYLSTIASIIFGIFFNASLLFAEGQPTEVKSGDQFVSQGQDVLFNSVNHNISTIKDWNVKVGNNSLIMSEVLEQDLDETKTVYDTPIYRKNVQFLVYNEALPIDQKRFDEITAYLTKRIGENAIFSNFQIDEQKLIDLHGKQDAYLIYTLSLIHI